MATIGDAWRYTCTYDLGGNQWRNSFDIHWAGVGEIVPPQPTDDIITALTQFFAGMQYSDVSIVSQTLSNIVYKQPQPAPITPPIWIDNTIVPGNGNVTWGGIRAGAPMPKDVAIYIRKSALPFKAGKLFVRNVLDEGDVQSAVGGSWVFNPSAGRFTIPKFQTLVANTVGQYTNGQTQGGNWTLSVTHLENIPNNDPRTPFSTNCIAVTALRPVWNDAHR